MKTIAALLLLYLSAVEYTFDYRLDYEITGPEMKAPRIVHCYGHHATNDYYANLSAKSDGTYSFYFRDRDEVVNIGTFTGDYRNPGTTLTFDSLSLAKQDHFAYLAKEYEIVRLADTLLGERKLQQYVFRMINRKKAKRKKSGQWHYLIDTTQQMKPLLHHPNALNIWKRQRLDFDGLVVEQHYYDHKGRLDWSSRLKEMEAVDFRLIVSDERN